MISEDLHVTLYNLPNGAIFVSALNEVSIRSFTWLIFNICLNSFNFHNISSYAPHVYSGDIIVSGKETRKSVSSSSSSSSGMHLFILKNMGAAIIDFRVCPLLVKCQNLMFSGFIDTLMYCFSCTGVTIYCYFGLKFNDNTCCEVIVNGDIMTMI